MNEKNDRTIDLAYELLDHMQKFSLQNKLTPLEAATALWLAIGIHSGRYSNTSGEKSYDDLVIAGRGTFITGFTIAKHPDNDKTSNN